MAHGRRRVRRLYVDANAISPATRRAIAGERATREFVDGGIIGPPPRVGRDDAAVPLRRRARARSPRCSPARSLEAAGRGRRVGAEDGLRGVDEGQRRAAARAARGRGGARRRATRCRGVADPTSSCRALASARAPARAPRAGAGSARWRRSRTRSPPQAQPEGFHRGGRGGLPRARRVTRALERVLARGVATGGRGSRAPDARRSGARSAMQLAESLLGGGYVRSRDVAGLSRRSLRDGFAECRVSLEDGGRYPHGAVHTKPGRVRCALAVGGQLRRGRAGRRIGVVRGDRAWSTGAARGESFDSRILRVKRHSP